MSELTIPKSEKHLFAPGPTNVPEDIRREVAKDLIHHVTPEYAELLWRVTDKLKKIFKTEKYVLSTTATGSAGMEASVVNFFSKGDKVIVLNTGNFGNRYVEICNAYGLNVIDLKYEWGQAYKLEDVKKALAENSDVKGIIVNHSETSTGVLNDVRPLGELTRGTDMLLIVDAISGLIVNEFKFDEWGIDCAVAASQKGFLLPPGLIYFALSEKAKKAMATSDLPKFYFDFQRYFDFLEQGRHPQTPAINLVIATDYACDYLLGKTIEGMTAHHKMLREYIESELVKLGFRLFVEDEDKRSNTVVPVWGIEGIPCNDLRKKLSEEHDITIAGGYGYLQPSMLRVGNIGKYEKSDIDFLVSKMKIVIDEMKAEMNK